MKIDRVSVRYGELRSSGYPSFSNTRHEVELSATLTEGETTNEVRLKLRQLAKDCVKEAFGDKDAFQNEMDLPF